MVILYILLAILVLMLMVTIHEFGHYIAGKILKFKINEFSIGFGPSLFSRKKKNGELFSIRIIPLGGYCAFEGEDEASNDELAFDKQAPWKRIIVLIAGGLFNIVSGIIFSVILLSIVGYDLLKVVDTKTVINTNSYTIASTDLITQLDYFDLLENENKTIVFSNQNVNDNNKKYFFEFKDENQNMVYYLKGEYVYQYISENVPLNYTGSTLFTVNKLTKYNDETSGDFYEFDIDNDSVFEYYLKNAKTDSYMVESIKNSTLKSGDIIYKVNGKRVGFNTDDQALALIQKASPNGEMTLTVKRDGKKQDIVVSSHQYQVVLAEGVKTNYALGISMAMVPYSFVEALGRSIPFTFEICVAVLEIVGSLLTGKLAFSAVGGPVTTIATIAGYSSQSLSTILVLLPLIAANLGVFNLLPIPALDGSKVIFCIIEWIRKKPINKDLENKIHSIGILVLFGLVIIADLYQMFVANILSTLF